MTRSTVGVMPERRATTVVVIALALSVTLGACSLDRSPSDLASEGAPVVTDEATTTTEPPRDCTPRPLAEPGALGTTGTESLVVAVSRQVFPCADRVVVAGASPAARWTGAREAMADGSAYLVTGPVPDPALASEITRLAPDEVVMVGVDGAADGVPSGPWTSSIVAPDPTAAPPAPPAAGDRIWLTAEADPNLAAALAPLAAASGAAVLAIPAGDPRLLGPEIRARLASALDVTPIGTFPPDTDWQLASVRSGLELPGGGLTVFPDRRYVAFYGVPGTSALGVLGEQDPAATLARMAPLLAEYETGDGVTVVPSFELIATVASAEAGDDGDYSNEQSVASLRPYVDFAAENGVYVLLDLQPGRTDFLTQARRYEELLRLPHVGLALDPEWRLEPDQVHLRQFGSVDAAEVNEVSAWLAGLVREGALPQKMLLIHQFKLSMVGDRSAIEDRPELALVIQMDGQGPLSTKYETLAALVRGTEGAPWGWGWKNFYDEDSPMATPAQTLQVVPQPVYVSYQ
jgi:hypothetical protein